MWLFLGAGCLLGAVMSEELTLKWGTIKGWGNLSDRSMEILNRYFADGQPMSCMADHPDKKRRQILCELIDQLDGEIYLDWDGKYVTRDEAKEYVTTYGRREQSS
jgi:hypothetical protein